MGMDGWGLFSACRSYCRELNLLLITGTSLDARANEEEAMRIVYDTLKPSSLRLCRSGETALMVFAKQTGLVVDAGSDFVHLVPCYQMSFVDYAATYVVSTSFQPVSYTHLTLPTIYSV